MLSAEHVALTGEWDGFDGESEKEMCSGIDADEKIKWIYREQDNKRWTEFIWLRVGTCSGLL